ncbi:MAG: hypothetical protein UV70_C0011G0001 [Parcubacteria group bacterium GW2011_GWA2_43_13]|nr:MAG: hypothetical protein UV70_C0011G0001 [Parcubacteria group bacterium GW2011_GWA2_43_13]
MVAKSLRDIRPRNDNKNGLIAVTYPKAVQISSSSIPHSINFLHTFTHCFCVISEKLRLGIYPLRYFNCLIIHFQQPVITQIRWDRKISKNCIFYHFRHAFLPPSSGNNAINIAGLCCPRSIWINCYLKLNIYKSRNLLYVLGTT